MKRNIKNSTKISIGFKLKKYIARLRHLPTKFWAILLAFFGFADFLTWSLLKDVEIDDRWKYTVVIAVFALLVTFIVVIRSPTEEETLSNARAMFRKARKLYNSKKYDDALSLLQSSVALDPDSTGTQGLLGRNLIRLGNFAEGIPHLNNAIEQTVVKSNKRILKSNRAVANYLLGNYGESLQDYDANLNENPNSKTSHRMRAQIWLMLGKLEYALEDANKSLKIDPNYICGRATKAIILQRLGEKEKARIELSQCENLTPDDADAFYCLAQGYSALSVIENSLATLRLSIELDPKYKFRALLDPLLSPLREIPEFEEVIEGY